MKQRRPDLSIVIPAYCEEKRIGKTLDRLSSFLNNDKALKNKRIEVIVVSADSPDKTHKIISEKAGLFKDFVFIKPGPKVGKGRDVQAGMLKAKGKFVIFMDADLATPLSYLLIFLESINRGADLVVGARNLKKHHKSFIRRSVSRVGNSLFRIAGGISIEDSQCGFKMFTRRAAQICFKKMTIKKWGFDMELLVIAKNEGLNITIQRIDDWQDVPNGSLNDVFRSSFYTLKDLLIIVINRIRGIYLVDD